MKAGRNVCIVLTVLFAFTCQAGWTADEKPLRTSQTLQARQAPDETERALLHLEAKVGQTLIDDRALIKDLHARLDRIAATVIDLHKLLVAMPAGGPCKPVTAVCPAVAAPTGATGGGLLEDLGDLPSLPVAAGAGVLVLLGLLWQRRRKTAAQVGDEGAALIRSPVAPAANVAPAKATTAVAITKPDAQAPGSPAPTVTESAMPVATAASSPLTGTSPAIPFDAAAGQRPAGENGGEADLSLELADVMLSMGLTDGAAQTLADHIRTHPRQALYHWLKLLDIYKHSGMKAEFESAARELQQHFNMTPPDWNAPPSDSALRAPGLESYAHISSRVQELWPRPSCAEYLSRLLEDNRGGTRSGFPQPIIEEILLLIAILRDLGG